jgi:hypothetical protein
MENSSGDVHVGQLLDEVAKQLLTRSFAGHFVTLETALHDFDSHRLKSGNVGPMSFLLLLVPGGDRSKKHYPIEGMARN